MPVTEDTDLEVPARLQGSRFKIISYRERRSSGVEPAADDIPSPGWKKLTRAITASKELGVGRRIRFNSRSETKRFGGQSVSYH